MNEVEMGSQVTATGTFKQGGTAFYDPSSVSAYYQKPDGTIVSGISPTHSSTGIYTFSIYVPRALTSVGEWRYRFEGFNSGGTAVASEETTFSVPKSGFYE